MNPKPTAIPTPQNSTVVYFDHTATMGGGEISLLNLVLQIDRSLYTPVVVLGQEGTLAEKLRAGGVETHVLPLSSSIAHTRKDSLSSARVLRGRELFSALHYVWRLKQFLLKRGARILHTNSLKADILGGVAGRLAGVPIIWHVRDRIADDYLPPLATRAFRWLCRVLPHYIVVNSRATLNSLSLLPSANARVVYNGIDASRVHAMQDAMDDAMDDGFVEPRDGFPERPTGEAILGLVGRISPWKGQHIFVRAAAQVLAELPGTRFQIIGAPLFGEEEYEAQLRALVLELGIEGSVEFTGFRSDVPDLVASLDILVHASTTGEPFGQVVIEGMAAGKPVIATAGGGIPEIVIEGKTGLLVPMNDHESMARAMLWLLRHPESAHEMGRLGRARVRDNFTISHTSQGVQSLYHYVEQTHGARVRSGQRKWLMATAVLCLLSAIPARRGSACPSSTSVVRGAKQP